MFYLKKGFVVVVVEANPQHQIARQRLPNPSREGARSSSVHRGCSGAFGLELPRDWISLEPALRQFMTIFKKYRLTGPAGSVSKLTRRIVNTGLGARQSNAPPDIDRQTYGLACRGRTLDCEPVGMTRM